MEREHSCVWKWGFSQYVKLRHSELLPFLGSSLGIICVIWTDADFQNFFICFLVRETNNEYVET